MRVQGTAAARRIKYALGELAQRAVDVVVLVRGGGSRSDLAPFDTELVARAVAAMPVPVLTGVGHEIDRSVADEVAHTACKTPTACAQILVEQVRRFDDALAESARLVALQARRRAVLARRDLDEVARHVRRGVPGVLARERTRLARHHGRVDELARLRTGEAARELDRSAARLGERGRRIATRRRVHARCARTGVGGVGRSSARGGEPPARGPGHHRERARPPPGARARLLDHTRRRRSSACARRRERRPERSSSPSSPTGGSRAASSPARPTRPSPPIPPTATTQRRPRSEPATRHRHER